MCEEEAAKPRDDGCTRNPGPLVDSQLLEEIELLADVIAEASQFAGHLSRDEVDSLLGVTPNGQRRWDTEDHNDLRGHAADGGAPAGA